MHILFSSENNSFGCGHIIINSDFKLHLDNPVIGRVGVSHTYHQLLNMRYAFHSAKFYIILTVIKHICTHYNHT